MRDRLRQQRLEDRGWRFCRVWSTDWFNDRDTEIARVGAAFREALSYDAGSAREVVPTHNASELLPTAMDRPRRPQLRPYSSIADLTDRDLDAQLRWILTDGRLRTDDELFEDLFAVLGFHRRGDRITQRLREAVRRCR